MVRQALSNRHVFLALDNVLEESTECVRILLSCLSPGSKAIVTSRSLENLKTVLEEISLTDTGSNIASIPRGNVSFIQVPTLDEDEALRVFLQHALAPARLASAFTEKEMEVLKSCIQRCFFANKDEPVVVSEYGPRPGHYHPLSLKALGSYLKGIDAHEPLQWLHQSKILQESSQRSFFYNDSVFEILRVGYDALPSHADKLLFLDIAVFAPRGKLNTVHDLCDWLVAIHGMNEEQTLYKMKNLRRKSLIEDWEKSKTLKVTVHDLYVDFAECQIQLEDLPRRCVYERNGRALPSSGLRRESLVRLRLQTGSVISFPPVKLLEWSNLVVLDVNRVQQKSLDISPLNCLRSLKLKSFILETLTWPDNMEELLFVKLSCKRLVQAPDFTACSNLRELNIRYSNLAVICFDETETVYFDVPLLHQMSIMPSWEVVETALNFQFPSDSIVIEGLSSLTCLRRLALKNLPIRGSIAGLEALVCLEDLLLSECLALNALPELGRLTNLQRLDLSHTAIESLPGLENLVQLRELWLCECTRLKSLPDLRPCGSLKEVLTNGCCGLSSLPLVPESCTLISTSDLNSVVRLMIKCTDGSIVATASVQGISQHQGLEGGVSAKEELKAFDRGALMIARRFAAGTLKEEFDAEMLLFMLKALYPHPFTGRTGI